MLDRIYVEISNVCNLRCSFCTKISREPRVMSEEEFRLVAEKIRGRAKNLYLHLMGEPLLHPSLDGILGIAEDAGIPVSITTNGTLLDTRGDILISHAAGIRRVSISLHSAEANGVLNTEEYISSVIDFANRAAEVGIFVSLRLWNMDSEFGGGANSCNAKIEGMLLRAFGEPKEKKYSGYRLADRIFLEYDGVFIWPKDGDFDNGRGRCHAIRGQLGILADGTVVPCCLDADGDIPLGNIFDSTVEDILSSDRATAMLFGFRSGEMRESLCKRCSFATRFG